MTDPEKPDLEKKTDLEKTVTDEDAGTGKADTTPRGKSVRRTGSGAAVNDPAPEPQPAAGKKEFSLTVTASGIKRALGALVVIALIAAVGFLGWRTYTLQSEADAFADAKTASADFVTKLVTTLNAENAGNSKELLGPLSTGELRKRLEQERADTEQNVEALKIEVSSKISVVAVETVDKDSAKTVVMAEVTGRSVKLPTGGTSLMVFRLDLSKEDGQWLVSKVDGPPGSPSGQIDPSQSLPGAGGAPAPQPSPAPAPAG
ncbi:UNVERIFIED_ORG: Mce-associated membrane protein [Gordonia westfalica J30]